MLDPNLNEKLTLAYARIGELGYEISLGLMKGKDHSRKQSDLWEKALKIWFYLKFLFRHVDTSTTPPTLYRITEAEVNKLINCLDKIGELDKVPVVPTMLPTTKPVIINKGQDGENGAPGQDGTDANINFELSAGENELELEESIVGGVKTIKLGFTLYKVPTIAVALIGGKVFEEGTVVSSKNLQITTTKGSESIISLTTTDATLNTALQALINLPTLNGVSQPVVTTLPLSNLSVDTAYPVTVADDENYSLATDSISFVFPILYGANDNINPTLYTALTKIIEEKGGKQFTFNGSDKYFFYVSPDEYGDVRILDQNDIDVTDEFTKTTVTVTSSGLTNNWSHSYRKYITTDKTEINNKVYRIEYVG